VAAKANQKKLILAQGSLNRERPSILCVAHKFQGKGERVEGKKACAFGTFTPQDAEKRGREQANFLCGPRMDQGPVPKRGCD
jgi:hypothetical protein